MTRQGNAVFIPFVRVKGAVISTTALVIIGILSVLLLITVAILLGVLNMVASITAKIGGFFLGLVFGTKGDKKQPASSEIFLFFSS